MAVTTARLREVLHYDPETGVFTHRMSRGRRRAGDVAGTPMDSRGYIRLSVDSCLIMAHRAAVLYMTGRWPDEYVDHINGICGDNRWCNLREATNRQNQYNAKSQNGSRSRFKGVSWDRCLGKWQASIRVDGKPTKIGCFVTEEDAALAYNAMAAKHFGEFARLNEVV